MKDHELAKFVNELTAIAKEFGRTQQIRERISGLVKCYVDTDSNPNHCDSCRYKSNPMGGWCYMFRHPPTETCMKHTERP